MSEKQWWNMNYSIVQLRQISTEFSVAKCVRVCVCALATKMFVHLPGYAAKNWTHLKYSQSDFVRGQLIPGW